MTSATVPTTPVRAGVYCRLSRYDQRDQLGVRRQERDCTSLAKRKGWEVVEVYVDDDVSAYHHGKRPEYARLVRAIQSGTVNAIITYDLDASTDIHGSSRASSRSATRLA